ncbi:hypothetical protein GE09DRAFT_1217638 [Coniochaeta sp. 2T2.1]|nr:hypothetical protein GE09DRAFT_1217638 [Coniochaeta sp. 2T2.1]
MAVLVEVVAEMLRQEQEAMSVRRDLPAQQQEIYGAEYVSHQELGYGEEEEYERVADMGYHTDDYIQYDEPTATYGDRDSCDSDEFDDLTIPYEGYDDDEDIDFEFVYALHTFVATVEGQANATKGDTMVLLDDSNSYWWLVRVVKDSSIGYLPAEHIETPTERLARLNKHRNIDLSATMLGDQAEKTRNPLKSAMKRRKAKTVTFTAPTYVDYSDFDYSTEEEDLEAEFMAQQQQQAQQSNGQQTTAETEIEDETAKVEPLKPRSAQKETATAETQQTEVNGDTASAKATARTSEEIFETKSGDGPKKTSDGTVRDSFFKDDTVETKKITLTPNLLRDDTGPRSSSESKELKSRPSLDKLEKDNPLAKDDKKKKDKKEKEKKPGAIRSFFSRKDKKRSIDDDDDSFGKRSMDANEKDEEEPTAAAAAAPSEKSDGPQRNPSKLKKQQPRVEPTLSAKAAGMAPKESTSELAAFLSAEGKVKNVADVHPASMRMVEPDLDDFNSSPEGSPQKPSRERSRESSRDRSPEKSRQAPQSAQANAPGFRGQDGNARPQKVVQAKSRTVLDDSDSDEEIAPAPAPAPQRPAPVPEEVRKQQQEQSRQAQRPGIPGTYPDSYLSTQTTASDATERTVTDNRTPPQQHKERLSESPVHISPVSFNNPPPLMVDTSSQEEDHSSVRSSPELIDREDGDMHGKQDSITTSTSATTTSTWNDASLRAFFDSGSDIRDLLVVVYDKTDVVPAGPEHPIAGSLFKEQNAKLAEITTQLDNMLGDWLARKQRLRGTV